MFYKCLIILFIIQFCYHFIEINAADCKSSDQTCSQCIAISQECFWCEDKSFTDQKRSRCDTLNNLKDCVKKSGENNERSGPEFQVNKAFSNKSGDTIQLKPQEVKIKLRAGSKVNVPIYYKRAEDYPMDLYFLMDLSCTMLKHKTVLGEVGERLADSLKNATSNFKIGFGSFVDKPIMPFSAFKQESVECQDENKRIVLGEPPYSFSHKQSLTDKSKDFVREVKNARTSGNVDNPEGTLDALMQVLSCKDVIGWRTQSNKIIVVATDAEFHYAGDGKLAGIVTPNDGLCHTSKDSGNYTFYNLTDYPSMYQIAEKALGFNIVFSVSNNVKPVYKRLAEIIGGNARVAALEANDGEAVKLIKDTYDSIRSSVELRVKSRNPEYIDIQFYSKCHKNKRERTSKCEYKEIKEIMFEVEIQLKSCPSYETHTQEILIGLPNNENEVLKINLEMLCGCECDKKESVQNNSPGCSSNGTLACGICRECNGKRTGSICECDPDKPIDPKDPEKFCKNPNRTSICSDRGKCECNKCDCTGTGYQGQFCEIDESGCYPNNDKRGKKCNLRGECVDGKCKCNDGYTGSVCECTTSKIKCIKDNKVCSDQGKCECGQCKCKETTTQGTYCQFCPSCDKNKYCNESRECVPQICETYYGSKENCTQSCSFQNYPKELDNSSKIYENQCIFQTLDDECSVEFTYVPRYYEFNNDIKVFISNATKNCKTKLNLVVVSGSVVAGTLLVGLALLLIWKLLTEIWDRKEYARFQKELSKVNWEESENPLYKEAKSTFTNPMFALRERATKRLSRFTERFSRRFDTNN